MNEECSAYLAQLQRDWEREALKQQAAAAVAGSRRELSYASSRASDDALDEPTDLNALFDPETSLATYVPPTAPHSWIEHEDPRYMLGVKLPRGRYIGATPPRGAAFASMKTESKAAARRDPAGQSSSSSASATSSKRSSYVPTAISASSSSSAAATVPRSMPFRIPSLARSRRLPNDFLPWFSRVTKRKEKEEVTQQNRRLQQQHQLQEQHRMTSSLDSPATHPHRTSRSLASASSWKTALGWTAPAPAPAAVDPNKTPKSNKSWTTTTIHTDPRHASNGVGGLRRPRPESLNLFSSARRPTAAAHGHGHGQASNSHSRSQHRHSVVDRHVQDENQAPLRRLSPPLSAPAAAGTTTAARMSFDPYARQADLLKDDQISKKGSSSSWWHRPTASNNHGFTGVFGPSIHDNNNTLNNHHRLRQASLTSNVSVSGDEEGMSSDDDDDDDDHERGMGGFATPTRMRVGGRRT